MNTKTDSIWAAAEHLLRRDAEELRESSTSPRDRDDWTGEEEAKADYDEHIAAADGLAGLSGALGGWQPIETAPKNRTLLLGYFNALGNWRTLRGQWFSTFDIEEDWEEPDSHKEGWYETPVEIDDVPNCFWTEPTHWMPLPPPPTKESKS